MVLRQALNDLNDLNDETILWKQLKFNIIYKFCMLERGHISVNIQKADISIKLIKLHKKFKTVYITSFVNKTEI